MPSMVWSLRNWYSPNGQLVELLLVIVNWQSCVLSKLASSSRQTFRRFRFLDPFMTPGRMLPVSWYRLRILLTHPCETFSLRLISHGRMPLPANLMISWRMAIGSGRPLMKMPPSWLMRPWKSVHCNKCIMRNPGERVERSKLVKCCRMALNRKKSSIATGD